MSRLSKAWSVNREIYDAITQIALKQRPVGQSRDIQNFVLVDGKSEVFKTPRTMGIWEYSGRINPEDLAFTVRDLESMGSSECILIKPLPNHPANEFGIQGFVHILAVGEFDVDYTGDPELINLENAAGKKEIVESMTPEQLLEEYDLETLVGFVTDPNINTGELVVNEKFRNQLEILARRHEFGDRFINNASVSDLIDILKRAGEFLGDYDDLLEPEGTDTAVEHIAFGDGFVAAHSGNIRNILFECGFIAYSGREAGGDRPKPR